MSQVQETLFFNFAPDSNATLKYGRFKARVPGYGAITTSGSSTSVTYLSTGALDAYKHPFVDFSVGTIMGVRTGAGNTVDLNQVTTVTDDQNIVIATAKDYSTPTTAWWYQKFLSGTTAADGAVFVGDFQTKLIKVVVNALTSAGVTYSIQIRGYGLDSAWTEVYTAGIASATALSNEDSIQIPETAAAVRVGLRTTSGAPSASDQVQVYLIGQYGNPAQSSN